MRQGARSAALGEYLHGALWVLPGTAAALALVAGGLLSQVRIPPDSVLQPFAFAGTADDARQALITIASTIVTVIALVLGLTIVTLQLASTQFSPRLLRNFLRDRPNQVVLATFVATFAYSTAGLYTVRATGGEDFPRLAVSGAVALIFLSLGMLVFFVHHIVHSIKIDTVMNSVAETAARAVRTYTPEAPGIDRTGPVPPPEALALPTTRSGYVQAVHPAPLLEAAAAQDAVVSIVPRVGDHVVAGTAPLALAWTRGGGPPRNAPALTRALHHAVQIGPERTLQQDVLFGLRQLVDIALRALSPAINDPYTGVQALDRLSVLIAMLGGRTLGDDTRTDATGVTRVAVTGPAFADHLDLACGQIRRYGAGEPAVCLALLRLLATAAASTTDAGRRTAVADQIRLVLADAESRIARPADRLAVRALGTRLMSPGT
ncbi:DUF2254 domain-containing protein [Streptomyces sp. AV19]|uniref:DUF2254 domain-containing protein n=1 Tax=Streptomyces sp. AV19 TaxID=2793068 RepID=UPI0018FE5790|nr:DUF2254 domain-containing protein [Streptomyces sp. AV19]MBH1934831.1 DUF2254 domain-containing protein [Streptomyces sp. AV19]MDG4530564.1 DUF2254 domain-containing protein [Streptomyces sp. AV19]